jgi:hypothetical protein
MPVFCLVNSVSQNPPNEIIFEYKKLPKGESRLQIKNEFNVLQSKFKKLRLKVEERMPIYSQIDDFKWFIIKNKFGIYTITLANINQFEEDFVFSLRKKIETTLQDRKEILIHNLSVEKVKEI